MNMENIDIKKVVIAIVLIIALGVGIFFAINLITNRKNTI